LAIEVLTRRTRHNVFRALDDISFEVARGEVLGIIGANGAGKSTLLKIIAGVLDVTSGSIEVEGRVTAILELGLGFNPEYSGRENIFLSGLLYGMGREEVQRKLDSIIEFSGLQEFIDRPVKIYSSGMHSRLAFSIATAVDPDILIIDEALGAGDAAFVQKCLMRIRRLCSDGRTVLLVSHGTSLLAQLCKRVVWLDRGKVRMVGDALAIVQAYDLASHQASDKLSWLAPVADSLDKPSEGNPTTGQPEKSPASAPVDNAAFMAKFERGEGDARHVFRRGPAFIDGVELIGATGEPTTRLTILEPFQIHIRYRIEGKLPNWSLGVALAFNNKNDLLPVAQFMTQHIRPGETQATYSSAADRILPAATGVIKLSFPYTPFRRGEYILSVGILPNEPGSWMFSEYRHLYYTFSVDDSGFEIGTPIYLKPELEHAPAPIAPIAFGEIPILVDSRESAEKKSDSETLRQEIESICFADGGYPGKWLRHAACPVCDGGPLADCFEKYALMHQRCAACGFVFVNPYPPAELLRRLYDGKYYSMVREHWEYGRIKKGLSSTPYSAPRDVLERVIGEIVADKPSGTWLDVGGGVGSTASLVQRMAPGWRVVLNELNQRSLEIATNFYGLESTAASAEALHSSGERFDVISSVAVLEHTAHPREFLASHASLLKPGGLLVVIIPQFTELNALISKGSSPNAGPPFHLSLFNADNFKRALASIDGLEVLRIEQAGSAAFRLYEFVQFGDYWDITIPSDEVPEPKGLQVKKYSTDEGLLIHALDLAGRTLDDHFASKDGRAVLIGVARRCA
jgi:ABC-type polysaccharide/polyol phosphate transport system ATPase subunit/SAM-dependent methyltransferase